MISYPISFFALILMLFGFNTPQPQPHVVPPNTPTTTTPQVNEDAHAETIPIVVDIPVTPTPPPPTDKPTKPPQFVLLAFDGSQSIPMWKDTRAFAQELKTQGISLHFTYFVNAIYFLTSTDKAKYTPPQHPEGASAIGYGFSKKDIENRVAQLKLAVQEGHEIQSHAVGHWTGVTWSQDEWTSELTQFRDLMRTVWPEHTYTGFRAPELGKSDGLWPSLVALGYVYDTSKTTKHPEAWPYKDAYGLWEFPLGLIPFGDTDSKILAMDYNFYFKQTEAKDTLKKTTPEWQAAYDQVLNSYRSYFQTNYTTTRAPVQIGHHFSLWNDSLYWEALKTFARETCDQPEVQCVTFSEVVTYLEQR